MADRNNNRVEVFVKKGELVPSIGVVTSSLFKIYFPLVRGPDLLFHLPATVGRFHSINCTMSHDL